MNIDKQKLSAVLSQRGLTIHSLARTCGISRQSIYQMFRNGSVFNKPFEKIIAFLGVPYNELTADTNREQQIMASAPPSIRKIAMTLTEFARRHRASLLLFGSRSRGKKGVHADWDFGIFFPGNIVPKGFASLKGRLIDQAFPYRADIVVLNHAPEWFLRSVENDAIIISGSSNLKSIFGRRAA